MQAAFDRFGPEYHRAILASGVPARAAARLMPLLDANAQGIDFGCGSGVLGLALREAGLRPPLDGIDLSPVMLGMARDTGCYRHLQRANLLLATPLPDLPGPYDFAITVGLIGDYVPYYVALPHLLTFLKPRAWLGFAVEQRSTPSHALERMMGDLRLDLASETTLPVMDTRLTEQSYQFFVVRLPS